jgi:hypothetical protein
MLTLLSMRGGMVVRNLILGACLVAGALFYGGRVLGQTPPLQKEPKTQPATLAERVKSLEEQVKALEDTMSSFALSVVKMTGTLSDSLTDATKPPGSQPVLLDCDGHKYQEVHSKGSGLIFLVTCADIEPYLEGHRVRLDIGNPYFVAFKGFQGTLTYGGLYKADVSSPEDLRAGYWNRVTVNVNPSKPSDMGLVYFEMQVDTASMGRSLR